MKNRIDYGFVRVATAKPIVAIADPWINLDAHVALTYQAAERNVQFLMFPELSLTGYSCGDFFLQLQLQSDVVSALEQYLQNTSMFMMVTGIGLPLVVDNQLFNVVAVCNRGKVLGIIPKTFLPNYKEFYEARHFAPASRLKSCTVNLFGYDIPIGTDILITTPIPNFTIGIEICEDLWMPIPPSSHLCVQGATIIGNASASNELVAKAEYRLSLNKNQSARCMAGYVYASCGAGESTSDVVWSGHQIICDNGSVVRNVRELAHKQTLVIADIDVSRLARDRMISGSFGQSVAAETQQYRKVCAEVMPIDFIEKEPMFTVDPYPFVPRDSTQRDERCEDVFNLQTAGLEKRLLSIQNLIKHEVVIGISGGLDSTLALLSVVRAYDNLGWDRKGIIAVTMPGFGTTNRTKRNAIKLCDNLGVTLKTIPIRNLTSQLLKSIDHKICLQCLTCENSQARMRTLILMSLGFVIGTGDLSELALGWCTYNGDHMSMYNVNCGVPKTLIRYVVEWVAEKNFLGNAVSKILTDIAATPISPELLPGQKTEESVGKYDLTDFFLFHMMRNGFEPEKIFFLARIAFAQMFEPLAIKDQLAQFYERFFAAQFKRNAVPDGPKIGSVALSPRGDWRAPSDASGRIWIQAAKDIEV